MERGPELVSRNQFLKQRIRKPLLNRDLRGLEILFCPLLVPQSDPQVLTELTSHLPLLLANLAARQNGALT